MEAPNLNENHPEVTRTCSICKEELPLTRFEKCPSKAYGRGYRCHSCNRVRRYVKQVDRVISCEVCGDTFSTTRSRQRFCSKLCSSQQDRSGDWGFYFNRLLNKDRRELTRPMLQNLLEKQKGLCALSGVPLTCIMRQGYVPTNTSIDRVNAGEGYTEDNIQLVCCIVNTFRLNLPIKEYIEWCKLVVSHNA